MAALIHRVIMLPWDSPAGDGIHTGILPESGFTSGTRFRFGKLSGYGMYARVRAWQLKGHLAVGSTGGGISVEGDINIVAVARVYGSPLDSSNTPLGGEADIAKHGGYFGEDLTPSEWTVHTEEDGDVLYDPGRIALTFADVTGTVDGAITLGPVLEFEPISGVPLTFGENGLDIAARVDGGLPVTHDGSFDGYGEGAQTFILKIGAPAGYDVVGTGVTFNQGSTGGWWPYDTEDGNGPVYNADTGAWIQDASLFR